MPTDTTPTRASHVRLDLDASEQRMLRAVCTYDDVSMSVIATRAMKRYLAGRARHPAIARMAGLIPRRSEH